MQLNEPQEQAVTSRAQHLLILAGAGSGKTRVLVQRVVWLIQQLHVLPGQIMAVTFTNKAAQEMRHRLRQLLPFDIAPLWVGTFHGLCHRILRLHTKEAGLPDTFQILDGDDQLRILKRILHEQGFEGETEEFQRVQNFVNRQKDEMRRAHQVRIDHPRDLWMSAVYERYEQYCKKMGLVDFGEIILSAYELWNNHPELLKQYRDQFKYILVDEFQDTNTIQYHWIKALAGTVGSLMVVGDDDQSIYSWRGAKVENMHRFAQDYPDFQMVRLEQNYRSTSTILAAANALIEQNVGRMGKKLWTAQHVEQKIKVYGAFNDLDEARFIVEDIVKKVSKGHSLNEMAILYRSNAQSRILEQSLAHAKIAFKVYGGVRFFDRSEIKDILAYCRLIQHFRDDAAFERAVNTPPRGVGDRTLQKIRDVAREQQVSLWEAAEAWIQAGAGSGRAAKGVETFLQLIRGWRDAIADQLVLPELIEKIIKDSGLLAYLQEQLDEKAQAKIENSFELITATQEFVEQTTVDSTQQLGSFLSEVALNAGQDSNDEDNVVKLMTVHAAKGLEFPIVFITGLEDGLFPNRRALNDPARLEEERRLLYVGLTRAMNTLTLTYAQKRGYQAFMATKPSRFLEELPPSLLEVVRLSVFVSSNQNTSERTPVAPSRSSTSLSVGSSNDHPFSMGQRVRHPRFGEGTVVGGDGDGPKTRVEVNFSEGGVKWLMLAYAKLESV